MNKACDKTYFLQFHDTDGCKSLQSKKDEYLKMPKSSKMALKSSKMCFFVS